MKKIIFDIDPDSFTGSAFLIGLILVRELSPDEQDSVGNWLQLVGLVMQTYASQVTTLQSNNDNNDTSNDSSKDDDIDTIKKAIDKINKELDKIKRTSSN